MGRNLFVSDLLATGVALPAAAAPIEFSWSGVVTELGPAAPAGASLNDPVGFSFVIDPDLATVPAALSGLFGLGSTYGFQNVPVVASLNGIDYVANTAGVASFRLQIGDDIPAGDIESVLGASCLATVCDMFQP